MIIKTRYDLFKKIKEYKTGFSLFNSGTFFSFKNQQAIDKARLDLIDLSRRINQCNELSLNVSGTTLIESKLQKVCYNLKFNNKKLPVLKQYKHFSIENFSNGSTTELIQEHDVGTHTYMLKL